MSALALKDEGNEKFKHGKYEEALSLYTEALDLGDMKETDRAVIFKNRSMCHLKLEKYYEAASDATECECKVSRVGIL